MGCSTCKQNQSSIDKAMSVEMPGGEIYNGHFFLKVVTFIALLVAIPLIIVVLICQIFLTFFVPSKVNEIKKKFNKGFEDELLQVGILGSIFANIKERKILRKQRKFNKTTSYYDEPEIEVFDMDDIEDNNEKDSET